jgi:hypothetical protein
MSITVGEVAVDFRAKFDKLTADIGSAKNSISRGATEIRGIADTMAGYITAIGSGAFANYVKGAINAAGAIADLSQKTGISAETLSKFEYAAQMSGTSLEGVANGMKGLAKAMTSGKDDADGASEAFQTLGIKVKDSSGNLKSMDAVMLEVADKFAGMDNGGQKAALAMKIFGKAGADMIPMLNEGKAGIEEMMSKAEDLGLVVSDKTASAMESLGDKFDTVGMASQGTARQFAANITPALNTLADVFLDGSKKSGAFYAALNTLGDGMRVLASIGLGTLAAFHALGTTIGATAAAAATAMSGDFTGAKNIMKDLGDELDSLATYYGDKINKVWAKEVESQQKMKTETDNHTESKKKNTKEAENAEKAYKNLAKSIEEKTALLELENNSVGKVSESQKIAVKLTSDLESGTLKLTTAQLASIKSKIDDLAAQEELNEAKRVAKQNEDDYRKALEQAAEVAFKRVDDLNKQAEAQERENDVLRLGKEAVEAKELANMKLEVATLSLIVANDELLGSCTKETIAHKETLDALNRLIEARESGVHIKAAKEAGEAWEKMSKEVEKNLTDALMRGFEGGKGFAENLRDSVVNMFKTMVLRPIIEPISKGMTGMLGFDTGGGAGGGAESIFSMMKSGKSIWDIASGGLQAFGDKLAFGADAMGSWLMNNTSGAMNQFGGSLMGNAGTIGTVGSYLGGAGIGIGVGSAIAGDKSVWGMGGSTSSTIGAAIGAAIAGPIGAAVGGALGGVFNAAFGHGAREVHNTKLEGTISGGAATGLQLNSRWKEAGGWFTSDRHGNDISSLGGQTTELLSAGAKSILDSVKMLAEGLGLSAAGIMDITTTISADIGNTKGISKEALAAAIDETLGNYQDALIAVYAEALIPFQREGEKLIETFTRLSALQQASEALNMFGGIFSTIAASSVEARESMIQLAGGIDALMSQAVGFVKDYYSADEQAGMQARAISAGLQAAGIDPGTLSSKSDFRALVESLDPNKTTEREQLAALLAMAPQFAQMSAYLEANNLTLEDSIKNAPDVPILNSMLTPQQATAQNTANVATAVGQTNSQLSSISGQLSSIAVSSSAAATAAQAAAAAAGSAASSASAAASAASSAASRPTFNYDIGRNTEELR